VQTGGPPIPTPTATCACEACGWINGSIRTVTKAKYFMYFMVNPPYSQIRPSYKTTGPASLSDFSSFRIGYIFELRSRNKVAVLDMAEFSHHA
jgi:hypothetical protein